MNSPPQRPAVTLPFDLQNLMSLSVGTSKYSLQVSSRLPKTFMRYRGNKICPNERRQRTDSPKT